MFGLLLLLVRRQAYTRCQFVIVSLIWRRVSDVLMLGFSNQSARRKDIDTLYESDCWRKTLDGDRLAWYMLIVCTKTFAIVSGVWPSAHSRRFLYLTSDRSVWRIGSQRCRWSSRQSVENRTRDWIILYQSHTHRKTVEIEDPQSRESAFGLIAFYCTCR